MGKSIRSKRLRRLRSIKRQIVESHYAVMDCAKMRAQEAALAAPKMEISRKREALDVDGEDIPPQEFNEWSASDGMAFDSGNASSGRKLMLRPKRPISKRGKSKRDVASKRKKVLKF